MSKSGKYLINCFANPKSWTIIASIPNSYAFFASSNASLNSSSVTRVFKVKFVFTPLVFAYNIAFSKVVVSKLDAKALALNKSAPKYTLFAPFWTAAFKQSKSPTGESK